MPNAAQRPCTRCRHGLTRHRSGYCDDCRAQGYTGSTSARGYGAAWQRTRRAFLARYPMCRTCGRTATAVDHIERHAGKDDPRFHDWAALQSLCHACHNRKTNAEQNRRYFRRV